ncbi:exopolysaccharide biosynthesis GT4 family glycosyltransferase EpsE [Primorskyibacter sp. S187A]|uniref:exopolysaccharide biosynthesis GT4 family glycosyltransferase EpsE n=1 Tax=Primorskyibacter sp. S187A TaxID=3415130 RepID=UPI003C7C9AEA
MTHIDRIGYLVPQFPGQTHIFFWREIAELEAKGVTPVLFSTRPPPPGLIAHDWTQDAIARTTYLGQMSVMDTLRALPHLPWADIHAEARRDGRAVWKDAVICAGAAYALKRTCAAQGIEHVHVHSCARAALVAAFAQHLGGPSYSITLHGPLQDYGPAQPFKWRNAAFATIITQKLIAEMQAAQPDDLPPRIILRPMGVDTEVLQRSAPYRPVPDGEPLRVFSCGRLNIVKGHQDLIAAVKILRAQGRDVQLEIAGQDDAGGDGFRLELERILADSGVSDAVTLLGPIDADAVKDKLLEAHIFALASWHEPLGVAYMEAISCGVPTIGTDSGGVPELITDGVEGLLVPPKNPEALAKAIARIADNPELALQLSTSGRARMEREFSSRLGAETLITEMERLSQSG